MPLAYIEQLHFLRYHNRPSDPKRNENIIWTLMKYTETFYTEKHSPVSIYTKIGAHLSEHHIIILVRTRVCAAPPQTESGKVFLYANFEFVYHCLHVSPRQNLMYVANCRSGRLYWLKHVSICIISHLCLAYYKRDIYKQCNPRSDAAERGVWSESTLFA